MRNRVRLDRLDGLIWAMAVAVGGIAFLLMLTSPVSADPPDNWYVNPAGSDAPGCGTVVTPCLSINYAISEALTGTTVILMPGVYTQTATLSIDKPITLTSQNGVGSAIVSGNGSIARVILIESNDVTLSELEVRNGTADVVRQSDPYTGTVVTSTVVHDCGDECVQLANCSNCLIENVTAYDATQDGLNFANSRNSAIRNCEVYDSRSENGAIFVYGSSGITVENNHIHDSTASNGIYVEEMDGEGTTLLRNNVVENNNFSGRRPSEMSGVAVLVYRPLIEAAVDARVVIKDNRIENNTGDDNGVSSGHGIYWIQHDGYWAPIEIRSNQIISNNGDGVHVEVRFDHTGTVMVTGNSILDNAGHGIAVDNAGVLAATVQRNTITGNGDDVERGGGVYVRGGDGIILTNNIVAANSLSETTGLGAGLYVTDTRITLLHTTIAENAGGDGTGLYLDGTSTAALTNTILVSHTVGVTVAAGSTATLDATLWHGNGDDSGGAGTIISNTNVSGAPAFFGGGDYHITLASWAVDAGVDAGVGDDVDGNSRPYLSGYDLGADEIPNVDQITLLASPASITANGLTTTTLTATVEYKGVLQDGAPVLFTTTWGVFANWEQAIVVTTTQGTAATWLRSAPASGAVTSTVGASFGGVFSKTQVTFTPNACQADLTAWTEYATNPIFGQGVYSGPKAYYPSVLYSPTAFDNHGDEAYYKMWFGTSDNKTGYAISDDGLNWITVTVPLTDVNGYHAHVLYDTDQFNGHGDAAYYKMWYWSPNNNINYMTSTNGIDWVDYAHNPVITNTLGLGSSLVYDAYVIYNRDGDPAYYEAWIDNNGRVYYITSTNGITWTGNNRELLADRKDWESSTYSRVSILKLNGDYHMWYGGADGQGGNHGIGYAISTDGQHWIKSAQNPILHKDDGLSWRDDRTYTPRVLYSATRFDGHGTPEQYKMWFTARDMTFSDYAVGYATLGSVNVSTADTSGRAQVGVVGNALGQPFVVGLRDGCGTPASNVTVTFAISGTPGGAVGQSLSPLAAMTGAAGQVSATLNLGDEAGVYTVTAHASGVAGSPVVFTATAALPVDHFTLAAIADQVETRSFTITVTAEDALNNTATYYGEPVTLADSSGTISPTLSGPFVNGVLTQTVTITTGQADVVITATQPTSPAVTGASTPFDVQLLRVTNLNTGERFVTIQEAIDDADTSNGHTVLAAAGVYAENVNVDKRIILQGAGSGDDPSSATIIVAVTAEDPVIQIQASGISASERLIVRALRVTGATTVVGGNPGSGVELDRARSFVTFEDVAAVGNEGHGIAIDATGSMQDIRVLDSTLSNNGGSGFRVPSSLGSLSGLVISGSQITSNTSIGFLVYGAGERNVSVSGASFFGNATDLDTGGDVVFSSFLTGSVSLSNVAITSNDADAGIRISGSGSSPGAAPAIALSNVTIEGVQRGAALAISRYTDGSSVSFDSVTLNSNTPSGLHLGSLSGSLDVEGIGFSGSYSTAGSAPAFDVPNPGAIVLGKHRGTSGSDADVNVDATFVDWGITNLAAIEDKIYHQADDPTLGEVFYYGLTLTNDGSSPMADWVSHATITATLTGLLDPSGNVVSFTTDLGVLGAVTGTADAGGTVTTIITSTSDGAATITGTAGMAGDNVMSDTTQVTFAPLALDHFNFTSIPSQTAGEGFFVTVSARDVSDLTALISFNGWAVLGDATSTLVPTTPVQFHNGVWSGMVTVTQAYTDDVITATYIHDGSKDGVSNAFDVGHNAVATVTLSPASATITAGQSITYTVWATDTLGNGWDATPEATYEAESGAGGSWDGHVYASQFAGTWTVTATVDGARDTATLTVTQGAYTLAIYTDGVGSVDRTPDRPTYAPGETVTLTAIAAPGWTFDGWSGDLFGNDSPETLAMDGDKVITATFTRVLVSVQFDNAAYSVGETAGAATITVTLGATSTVPVTVTYATSNGTAVAGSDYVAISDTLRFDVGQTSRTFSVAILPDALREGDETVNLALSDPVNAALGVSEAVLTLADNVIYLPLIIRN